MNKDVKVVVYYVTMKDIRESSVKMDLDESGREINSDKMMSEKYMVDLNPEKDNKMKGEERFQNLENQHKKEIEQYRMKREKTFVQNSRFSPVEFDTTKYRPKSAGRSLHRVPKYTGDSDSDSDVFDGDIEILDLDAIEDCDKAIETARVPKPPKKDRNKNLWTPVDGEIHGNQQNTTKTESTSHGSSINKETVLGASGESKANGILRIKRKHLRRKYLSEVEQLDEEGMENRIKTTPSPSSHQSLSDDSADVTQSVEIITVKTLDIRQRRRSKGRADIVSPDQSDVSGSPRDADLIPVELHYQEAAAKALQRITRRASDSSNTEARKIKLRHQSDPTKPNYNTIPIEAKPTKVRPQIPRKLKPLFNHPEPRFETEASDFILNDIKRDETIPFTQEMYQKREQITAPPVNNIETDLNNQAQEGDKYQNNQTGNGKTSEPKQRRKLKPVQPLHTLPTLESSDIPDIQEIKDKHNIINSPLNKVAPIGSSDFVSQDAGNLGDVSTNSRHGNTTNNVFTVDETSTMLQNHNELHGSEIKSVGKENSSGKVKVMASGNQGSSSRNGVNIITQNKLYVKKPVGRTKSAPD